MPIYEYQCEDCGEIVENWQKITDPPLETCEACGGKLKKLISQSTFHLKGSGWYVTDYANRNSGANGNGRKNKESSSSESKSSSKDSGNGSSQ